MSCPLEEAMEEMPVIAMHPDVRIRQMKDLRAHLRRRGCGRADDDVDYRSVHRAQAWHRTGACRGWWRRFGLTSTVTLTHRFG